MNVVVDMDCPICHRTHRIAADQDGLSAWTSGELIQNALPELTVVEREQLITHLCPPCQIDVYTPFQDGDA